MGDDLSLNYFKEIIENFVNYADAIIRNSPKMIINFYQVKLDEEDGRTALFL